jgi:formate dehydrogenase subunit gamma
MSADNNGQDKTAPPDIGTLVGDVLAAYGARPDCLIEMLHDIQHNLGHVPDAVVPPLALGLNISRAEIHGVITFYHDFHRERPGRHVIGICRAEACQARGCRSLEAHAQQVLGVRFGETRADGAVTLKAVYCLGNCALGPAITINETLYGRVDADRFGAILAAHEVGRTMQ